MLAKGRGLDAPALAGALKCCLPLDRCGNLCGEAEALLGRKPGADEIFRKAALERRKCHDHSRLLAYRCRFGMLFGQTGAGALIGLGAGFLLEFFWSRGKRKES